MNIAFIGQKGMPARSGGVEHHVQELAIRLAVMGHRVSVYARNNYTPSSMRIYKNVRIVRLPSIATKHLDAISHTFLATLHALVSSYDVVHYQSIGPSSLAWIVRLLRPDVEVVSTFHCKDYEHQKWNWFARLYLRFSEFVTCIVPHKLVVVNQELLQYVKKRYGVDAVYIPNGSRVHYECSSDQLKELGLQKNYYVLMVNRLVAHKGVHDAVNAFLTLDAKGKLPKGMKLVIVGNGAHTNNYVNWLERLTKNSDKIVFVGECEGKALAELFSHAFCFVQASLAEGLSLSLLEAMGYGLPVIISDIIENKEAVGQTAVVFKRQNASDLAAKLSWLFSHRKQAKTLGRNAKLRAKKYFNWDSIAGQVLELYERTQKIRETRYKDTNNIQESMSKV